MADISLLIGQLSSWLSGLGGLAVGGVIGTWLTRRAATNSPAATDPLARAYRGSADGFWEWNIPTNEVLFSDSFKGLIGFAPHEMANRYESWEQRLHPADR